MLFSCDAPASSKCWTVKNIPVSAIQLVYKFIRVLPGLLTADDVGTKGISIIVTSDGEITTEQVFMNYKEEDFGFTICK